MRILFTCLVGLFAWPAAVGAQDLGYPLNSYGQPGLIDMPGAWMEPDGTLGYTYSTFRNTTRNALFFQVTPWLSGVFRYSHFQDLSYDGVTTADFLFDRTLSFSVRVAEEGDLRPAIALGVNDILGTGFDQSEYLVASKHFGPDIRATVGLGWGRLAGVGGFINPLTVFGDQFATRPPNDVGLGGLPVLDGLFHGDAAVFGGIEWQATPDLRLVAEYSSDAYPNQDGFSFERRSPVNLGASYAVNDHLTVSGHYRFGSELGVQLTYALDPARPPAGSGFDTAPPLVRAPAGEASTAQEQTRRALADTGITLHGLTLEGDTARVSVENRTYAVAAQAVGRTARVLTATLPATIERFEIVLVERGMPVSQSALRRSDLEDLEFALDGASAIGARSLRGDAADGPAIPRVDGVYPRFDWSIAPYIAPSLFDPDDPLRADVGLDLNASYEFAPGFIVSGVLRQPVFGNLDQSTRVSDSVLPRVRSEAYLYDKANPAIPRLTAAWYFRPGNAWYGRVTAGYLEPMFAGVSGELLWYPHGNRLALGAELNYVAQRDFDQLFGLRDYQVATGHVSAYYDLGHGFQAQLDVGRYLAGDLGATFSLDRRFENGWNIGAFATLTDVPFDQFGEGSFDKGIRLTIPLDWISGRPTRARTDLVIRPILRDGGARLNVDGRLYELVRPANGTELTDGWGRFWR